MAKKKDKADETKDATTLAAEAQAGEDRLTAMKAAALNKAEGALSFLDHLAAKNMIKGGDNLVKFKEDIHRRIESFLDSTVVKPEA